MPDRLPVEPLLAVLRRSSDDVAGIAADLDVTARTVMRWKRHGLSREQAERMALAAGEHPYYCWPELVAADAIEASRLEGVAAQRAQHLALRRRRYYLAHREQRLARQRVYDAARRRARREARSDSPGRWSSDPHAAPGMVA